MLDEGYGIMPNKVLYDTELSSSAKLLYCAISSLCAQRGYCYASNAYLAKQFGVKERQITRWLGELSKYATIESPYNQQRVIRLDKKVYPPRQKRRGSLDKKDGHIITSDKYKKIRDVSAEEEIARRYTHRPTVLPEWVRSA